MFLLFENYIAIHSYLFAHGCTIVATGGYCLLLQSKFVHSKLYKTLVKALIINTSIILVY